MRGQQLGGSVVARFNFAGIRLSTAERNDKVRTWRGRRTGVAIRDFDVPVTKVEGVMGNYGHGGVVGDLSSEVSLIVKPDRVEILADGE